MTPARLVRVLGDVLEVFEASNAGRGIATWRVKRARGIGKGMKVKDGGEVPTHNPLRGLSILS